MKYIKPYQIFEANAAAPAALTQEQIDWLDKCVDGSWKLNPQTGLIDVNGDFDCREQGLTDLKGVKFGKVSGDFNCYNNQLTTLEGSPQSVGRSFNCDNNHLTTLEGAPQSVGRSFYCIDNQLTSLEGAPQSVSGSFSCNGNHLTSLEGAPQTVGGYFSCEGNELTSLVGAPQTVGVGFHCGGNELTTLVGAPEKVGGDFYCEGNPVSESTLKAIFALMRKGMAYQQALEKRWSKVKEKDRELMYKQMPNLPPEETRKYKALATYNNIKGYL